MSQTYGVPAGTDPMRVAVKTTIANSLEALRSVFSGSSAPASPVAFQLWLDTTNNALYQRNAANSAWVAQKRRLVTVQLGALSARTWRLLRAPVPLLVVSVALEPSATTSGSVAATTEWTWMLKNQTTGNNLFSATPSTATTVSGVGGGELTADTGYVLTANQNQALAAGDLLRFIVGQNGSPTAVGDAVLTLDAYELQS